MKGRIGIDLAIGLGLRGLGAVSGFVLLWLIAQTNGAQAVGAYQLGLTTATVLAVIALAGQDILIIRQAPQIIHKGSLADLRATYFAGRLWALGAGSVGALVMLAGAYVAADVMGQSGEWSVIVLAFFPAVMMLALLRHSNALLRSQGSVLISQSLEGVLYTSIAAAIVAALWLAGSTVAPITLPLAYLGGLVLALAISLIASQKLASRWTGNSPRHKAKLDLATGLRVTGAPILMMSGEWLTLLALGALAGLSEAGVYRTAFMICMLFQLVNASFATMAGPHIAKASAVDDRAGVMGITWKVGLIGLVLVAPLAALCLIVPGFLLGLFGEEFVAGALTLQLLAAAQTVNVVFGPVGTALIMVGRERQVLAIEIVASSIAVLLALILIPQLGMVGAAIGFASATVLRNTASRIALNFWRPDTSGAAETAEA